MKWKEAQKERKLKLYKDAKKHPRYKGKVKNDGGYILIYSANHPYKDKHNRVREHRLVMEKHLGRYLKPEEVVHHLDGIKDNNRIGNLKLFKNHSEHRKWE